MSKNKETSKAIDLLIYSIALGSVTGAMLFAPNAVQILDKPLAKLFDNLDERQRQRELSRLRSYLKTQGLDYWNTPIPEYIKTNPHYGNKEYLSKY